MSPFDIGDELVELRSRKLRAPVGPARRRLWLLVLAVACVAGLAVVTLWLCGLRAPRGPALSTRALVRATAAAPLRWAELREPLPIASRIRREVPIAFVPKRGSDPFARDLPAPAAADRQETGAGTLTDVFARYGDEGDQVGEAVEAGEPSDAWVGPDSTISSPTQEGLAQESLGAFDSDQSVESEPQAAAAGDVAEPRAHVPGAAAGQQDQAGAVARETGQAGLSEQPSTPRAQPAPAPARQSAGTGAVAGAAGAREVVGADAARGGPAGIAVPAGTAVSAPAAAASAGAAYAPAGALAASGDEEAPAKQAAVPGAEDSASGTKAAETAARVPAAGAKPADAGVKPADTGTKPSDAGAKPTDTRTKPGEAGTKPAEAGTRAVESTAKAAPTDVARGGLAPGAGAGPRTITAPLVRLTGVITVDGRAYAIVRTPLGSWIVRPGDSLEGIAVRSIGQKRIVVEWQGEQFSVELGGGVER